jgi:propanol-preferring alcohol dehydrogenase
MSAVKIPDALTDEEAAPLLCAGVTAYGAVKKVAQYQAPGTLVNVVGCGGVGHLVIQYADKMGFDVQAFDVAEDKLELARKCGTKFALDSSKPEAAEAAEKAVCTIVVSGVSAAYDFAFKVTSHHGKVIAIGVPHSPTPVNILDLVLRDISLIGKGYDSLTLDQTSRRANLTHHSHKPGHQRRAFCVFATGRSPRHQARLRGKRIPM